MLLIRLYDIPAGPGAGQYLLVAAVLFVEGQLLRVILGNHVLKLHLAAPGSCYGLWLLLWFTFSLSNAALFVGNVWPCNPKVLLTHKVKSCPENDPPAVTPWPGPPWASGERGDGRAVHAPLCHEGLSRACWDTGITEGGWDGMRRWPSMLCLDISRVRKETWREAGTSLLFLWPFHKEHPSFAAL